MLLNNNSQRIQSRPNKQEKQSTDYSNSSASNSTSTSPFLDTNNEETNNNQLENINKFEQNSSTASVTAANNMLINEHLMLSK